MKKTIKIDELISKVKPFVEKMKALPLKTKVFLGAGGFVVCAGLLAVCIYAGIREEVIYVETLAQIGNLTVGITEEGNVSVEETEQTFDVDISEFSSDNTNGFAWENPGGMGGMMQGITQIFSGESTSSDTRELIVEEVLVSVGQEIEKGTPICRLTEESLAVIRNGLVDDEAVAKNTLEERETDLKVSEVSASQTLQTNLLYGTLAQVTYDATVSELNDKVETAQENLEEMQKTLAENEAELAVKQEELAVASKVFENAEYIKDGTDMKTQLYFWVQEMENWFDAEATVESLEKEVETLTETIEKNTEELENLESSLLTAKKSYETGIIEAKALYDTQILKYETAQEIYDTTIASSELSYEIATDEYEEAKVKLDEFNAVVVDNHLVSLGEGVISRVSIEAGSSIYRDSAIITYNDYENVSITVTLEEEDREKIETGSAANVVVSALENTIFEGEVTEIGDAVYDNDSGTNTYEVTVTLSGDLEKVFDGMSAEITLITKDEKEVLYVVNRSIVRQGSKSYVKVKRPSGKIDKVEVKTGFSDGVNVEIIEGLSEGDIVLVESKVSES